MLPKIKKINLSTQLVETMTTLIETDKWRPGMKLPNELELAASFNVSRNIMREAMKILENFGILESKAGIGTFISETAMSSIHNMHFFDDLKNNSSVETILETRLIIEPELSYYAALRGSDEQLSELRNIFDSGNEYPNQDQLSRKEDFDFHMCIARASGNNILESLLLTMLDQLRSSKYVEFDQHARSEIVKDSYGDHREIAMAILHHRPELARELMAKHLSSRIYTINTSYNTVIE